MGIGRSDGLQPRWYERIVSATPPPWLRSRRIRLVLAAALGVLALVLALRPDPATETRTVVVAAHDLAPGVALTAEDLSTAAHPARLVGPGTPADPDDLVGQTLATALAAGDPVTGLRVIGPELARAAVGSDRARMVPVRPADPSVTDLLRPGDRVDVITVDEPDPIDLRVDDPAPPTAGGAGTVLARGAPVIMIPGVSAPTDSGGPVLLIALPEEQATEVAAASLTRALTVTVH